MDTLDGNALAGLLYEVFGEEMTSFMATCATCGAVAAIAETVVYPHLPGAVARCRTCGALLMVITHIHGVNCVDLEGIAALNAPAA
jgi:ribosomal protein S27E